MLCCRNSAALIIWQAARQLSSMRRGSECLHARALFPPLTLCVGTSAAEPTNARKDVPKCHAVGISKSRLVPPNPPKVVCSLLVFFHSCLLTLHVFFQRYRAPLLWSASSPWTQEGFAWLRLPSVMQLLSPFCYSLYMFCTGQFFHSLVLFVFHFPNVYHVRYSCVYVCALPKPTFLSTEVQYFEIGSLSLSVSLFFLTAYCLSSCVIIRSCH